MDIVKRLRDRSASNPGGCECQHCGCIFIGEPTHDLCGVCIAAVEESMRENERLAEWRAEMRHDAFGDR